MIGRKQQGVALILAILVVALASTIAVFMAAQQSMWTQQASNLAARAETQALAHAAIDWARGVLAEDARNNNVDHLGESWATPLSALPVESANLSGAIYDQQAFFNLNNLVRDGHDNETDITLFKRLLAQLQLPLDLVNPLLDWLDEDNTTRAPGGAEDTYYLQADLPYRCANQALLTVEELYRVRGFNRAIIDRLKPYISVLPEHSTINVNTAPREILMALLPDLAETDISTVLENRKRAFFKSKQDFRMRLPQAAPALRDDAFDVTSHYFSVVVVARANLAETAYEALLTRPPGGGWPGLVWQRELAE